MSHSRYHAWAQYGTWVSYSLLILSMIGFWQLNPGSSRVSLLFLLLPLLIFIPGMLKRHNKSYIWLCFILLFYFCKGVSDMFIAGQLLMGLVITTLSVSTFVGAFYFVRLQYHGKPPRSKT